MTPTASLPVIAIDGAAASGKGTLAQSLSAHYDFAWLDSGLLYRAVAHKHQLQGGGFDDEQAVTRTARMLRHDDLQHESLRDEAIGHYASRIAAYGAVRAALLQFQRDFGNHAPHGRGGSVIDGRDIGSVIFPKTPYKIFLKASFEVRFERRLKELQQRQFKVIPEELRKTMRARDQRDCQRALAPLICCADALPLDSDTLTAAEVMKAACQWLSSKGLFAPSCRADNASTKRGNDT